MAASKLDAAGAQMMKTLEVASQTLQTIHGIVERGAIDVKNKKPLGVITLQIKRIAAPMQGQLKGQFGMVADLVANFILSSTRGGGGDVAKLRSMREGVAQIRVALEMAGNKVKATHSVDIAISAE